MVMAPFADPRDLWALPDRNAMGIAISDDFCNRSISYGFWPVIEDGAGFGTGHVFSPEDIISGNEIMADALFAPMGIPSPAICRQHHISSHDIRTAYDMNPWCTKDNLFFRMGPHNTQCI